MIVGAAVVPSAPVLVPGVSAVLPPPLAALGAAVDLVLRRLLPHDVAVLIAAAPRGGPHGCYDAATADLAGIGRPDLVVDATVDRDALGAVTRMTQTPLFRSDPLPLGAAVLLHHLRRAGDIARPAVPVVPVTVPPAATADVLVGIGAGIASAVEDPSLRAVIVVAGDLSAGLTARAPLAAVDGARAFDDQVVDVVASGRLDGLTRLGPGEARRVGALGWAPLMVLHGACARAGTGIAVRTYGAPRGVGYLVAAGG